MKESLRSPAAYTLFLRSARWTIVIGVFTVLFPVAVIASLQLGLAHRIPQPLLVLPLFFAVPGAAAGAIIFFGMFAYLLAWDKSSTKAFWIAIFLVRRAMGPLSISSRFIGNKRAHQRLPGDKRRCGK